MIDAVIVFACINVLFELVLLGLVPPKLRLFILGNPKVQAIIHVIVMGFVLRVHWGTLIGTMSGFLSFVLSIITVWVAILIWGKTFPKLTPVTIIGYNNDGTEEIRLRAKDDHLTQHSDALVQRVLPTYRRGIIGYKIEEVL